MISFKLISVFIVFTTLKDMSLSDIFISYYFCYNNTSKKRNGLYNLNFLQAINVKCEKSLMKVNIEFDRPFYGLIFSKGHYR